MKLFLRVPFLSIFFSNAYFSIPGYEGSWGLIGYWVFWEQFLDARTIIKRFFWKNKIMKCFPRENFLIIHPEVHLWCQEVSQVVEYFSDWICCYVSWCLLGILSIFVFKKYELHFFPPFRTFESRNSELIPSLARNSQSFFNPSSNISIIEGDLLFCSILFPAYFINHMPPPW